MRRLRSILVLAILVAGGSIVGAAPARADYHTLCTARGDGFDALYLTRDGAALRYRGYVTCTGQPITIHTLTITPAGGATSSVGPRSCTDVCELSATVPATAGRYTLTMSFTVGTATPSPRQAQFVYSGAGDPIKSCPVGGFRPPFNLCV